MPLPDASLAVLPFGRYYGYSTSRHHAPGVELQVLDADPSRRVEWHSHQDAHLIYVIDGLYLSAARGGALHRAGTLIYNPPGTLHRDRFESVNGRVQGRFLAVAIDRGRLSDRASTVPSATVLDVASSRIAAEVLAGLATADVGGIRRGIEELCHMLGRVARTPVPGWLERARVLLADPDDQGRGDVAAVAEALGIHRVYLARRFRAAFGIAPAGYRLRRRAQRAIGLLRATALPMSQVAAQAGFFDQSHLSRAIRHVTGRSPAAHRHPGPAGFTAM